MSRADRSTRDQEPRSTADLRDWVQARLDLEAERAAELLRRVEEVVARQRQLVEESPI